MKSNNNRSLNLGFTTGENSYHKYVFGSPKDIGESEKPVGFVVKSPEISVQDETPPRDPPVKALMVPVPPGMPDSMVPLKLPITNPVVYKAPEKEPAYQRITYKVLSAHDIKERLCTM